VTHAMVQNHNGTPFLRAWVLIQWVVFV